MPATLNAIDNSRLTLHPAEPGHPHDESVDGAWWPHSVDLETEIGSLISEVSAAGFQACRVSYSLGAWTAPPRRVFVDGAKVSLGGFRSQHRDMITLVDGTGWNRLDIRVIAPDTDPDVARKTLSGE